MLDSHGHRPPESSRWWATAFKLRESYQRSWLVIPSLYVLLAVVLGVLLPQIENTTDSILGMTVDESTSKDLLQSISSGMIGFTGLVVSIAVLVVQFGAGTYTPRLVLWFRRDPLVKHSLGLFVAPAVFSLVALYRIERTVDAVPVVTVSFAMLLLIFAIGAFFVMIGRLLDLLRPRKLYQRLGEAVHRAIEVVYPHRLEDPMIEPHRPGSPRVFNYVGREGVFSAIARHHLLRIAEREGATIELLWDVGSYLPDGTPMFVVHGDAQVSEENLSRAIIVADERTITQDPNYGIRAIVDIAIRALSPAVNDPTTAVQGLDTIESLLHHIGHRQLGVSVLPSPDGAARVIVPAADWDELLDLSLHEIRHFGVGSIQVTRRMSALLAGLEALADPIRQDGVRRHMRLLADAVEREIADPEMRAAALAPDRVGLGGSSEQLKRWRASHDAPAT